MELKALVWRPRKARGGEGSGGGIGEGKPKGQVVRIPIDDY